MGRLRPLPRLDFEQLHARLEADAISLGFDAEYQQHGYERITDVYEPGGYKRIWFAYAGKDGAKHTTHHGFRIYLPGMRYRFSSADDSAYLYAPLNQTDMVIPAHTRLLFIKKPRRTIRWPLPNRQCLGRMNAWYPKHSLPEIITQFWEFSFNMDSNAPTSEGFFAELYWKTDTEEGKKNRILETFERWESMTEDEVTNLMIKVSR